MAALVLNNLSGLTVTYNTVQWGGGDATYKSTPPTYRLAGEFVYDDSNRAVKYTRYILEMHSIFTVASPTSAAAEVSMGATMEALRRLLKVPGKTLTIAGLGTGFDRINGGFTAIQNDVLYGPRPLRWNITPWGRLAFEIDWAVEFHVSECLATQGTRNPLAFVAFNFETTWSNDFEGLCSRTISGYAEIAVKRDATGKTPTHIVDEVRDNISILVPEGFRRTSNVWREDYTRSRLTFSVTDEAQPGDFLPLGCIAAGGDASFESVGPGFNEAVYTLNMHVRTALDAPRNLAGILFLTAALTKDAQLRAQNPNGTAIPARLSLRSGKFDQARDSSFSMSWTMTKCINEMLKATDLWEPVPIDGNFTTKRGNYDLWRTSVQHLWGNRGIASPRVIPLRSQLAEAKIIDLCENQQFIVIGATGSQLPTTQGRPQSSFACPNIPADGGWIEYDLRIRILRKDEQWWHKLAVAFMPSPGSLGLGSQEDGTGSTVGLGGPSYSQSQDQEHVVEHNGLPTVHVLLQFKGLRIKHKPPMPELKSISGNLATLVEQNVEVPRVAFDLLTCPAWFTRGYRIYRINGYVSSAKPTPSETSCGASVVKGKGNSIEA